MAAYLTGVGVGGHKGLLSHSQHILKALIVEVGDIHQNPTAFQLWDGYLAKRGQPLCGGVPRADFIFSIPGQGNHPHTVLCQQFHPLQLTSQNRSVFNGEYGGGLSL